MVFKGNLNQTLHHQEPEKGHEHAGPWLQPDAGFATEINRQIVHPRVCSVNCFLVQHFVARTPQSDLAKCNSNRTTS